MITLLLTKLNVFPVILQAFLFMSNCVPHDCLHDGHNSVMTIFKSLIVWRFLEFTNFPRIVRTTNDFINDSVRNLRHPEEL